MSDLEQALDNALALSIAMGATTFVLVLAALALLTVAVLPVAGWSIEAPFAALALLALWFAAGELHSIPVFRKVRS